jgi:hypothetical protein
MIVSRSNSRTHPWSRIVTLPPEENSKLPGWGSALKGPEVLLDGLLDLREGRRLGIALEHGEELARLGIERSVHVGQDLPHFHRDALQLAERFDKSGECLRRKRAKVEVPAAYLASESTEPEPCSP